MTIVCLCYFHTVYILYVKYKVYVKYIEHIFAVKIAELKISTSFSRFLKRKP